jgi:hypothetical protein
MKMTLGVGMNLALNFDRTARLLARVNPNITNEELCTQLGFHRPMVSSIKSWASHIGLLTTGNKLSDFGSNLLALDPTLQHYTSRLLLFYRLAANPKAEVFHYLINYFLYNAAINKQRSDITQLRNALVEAGVGANSQATKQLDKEVRLMLGTLYRLQAFGPLRIVSSNGNQCLIAHPPQLSPAFVAYVVYNQWQSNAAYTSFDELEQAGQLAHICLLTRPALIDALRMAENSGYLSVQQGASFNRVSRIAQWNDVKLLEELYA